MVKAKDNPPANAGGSDTVDSSSKRTHKRSMRFYLIYSAALLLFSAGAAEMLARLTGRRPWVVQPAHIKVEPGGRFFQAHPTLGYTQLAGQFKITLDGTFSYTVTNLSDTLRITHPLNTYPARDGQKEIWVFGDSITYGQSVNDAESFCWLLEEKFPALEFVNFGVEGYGNVQSLIQLREALRTRKPPRLAIVVYGSWQDVRNTSLRAWRKMLSVAQSLGSINQPYARLNVDGSLAIAMDEIHYREFPLMRYSAFSNALEEAYDRYEERHAHSHEVTKAVIEEMARECQTHGIEMAVVSLTSDPTSDDMLGFCQTHGIRTANIWLDLTKNENNNLPYDSHPNANAHRIYAQKLETFLKSIL